MSTAHTASELIWAMVVAGPLIIFGTIASYRDENAMQRRIRQRNTPVHDKLSDNDSKPFDEPIITQVHYICFTLTVGYILIIGLSTLSLADIPKSLAYVSTVQFGVMLIATASYLSIGCGP
jgi:Na+/glutamate symporter